MIGHPSLSNQASTFLPDINLDRNTGRRGGNAAHMGSYNKGGHQMQLATTLTPVN